MHAPNRKPHTLRIADLSLGVIRLFALVLALSIAPLLTADFSAKASEKVGEGDPGQASAKADQPETGSADKGTSSSKVAPEAPGEGSSDYCLSAGDLLKLVVLDQPELSGIVPTRC